MTEELMEELQTKLSDLGKFCTKHKLPMFFIYAEETEDHKTRYGHSVLTPFELGVELTDDKITKYSASLNKNFTIHLSNSLVPEDRTGDIIEELIGDPIDDD